MNEQAFDGEAASAEGPTSEQAAILAYLGLPFDVATTRSQATALIDAAENDLAGRTHLQAWHRDKYRLHPDLFAPPQRSFREGRWWQGRVTDGNLYGYSFHQPSLSQTLVILESLDTQEPGWERESKARRETRFMNELATLSPELCKPGCAYPQELPVDDPAAPAVPEAPIALAALPAPRAPSIPFAPGSVPAPGFTTPSPTSKPSWATAPSLSTPPTKTLELPATPSERRRGGTSGWLPWVLGLAVVGIVGAAGYVWSHRGEPELSVRATSSMTSSSPSSSSSAAAGPKPAGAYAPVPAKESRQRAIAKHPELAQAGTPLNAKFIAAYHILESQHSPRLLQPDWPEQLADEFAAAPASPAPATTPRATTSPTPATPKASVPAPAATPHNAQRTTAVAPASGPVVSAAPPAALSPAALPVSAPAGMPFVTLDAINKTRANHCFYSWSPFYYGDYDISFRQTVGIETTLRNMTRGNTAVILRWMFFGRKTSNNERYVFAAAQKRLELAAGQSVVDTFDSPMLQSKAAVGYNYGMH